MKTFFISCILPILMLNLPLRIWKSAHLDIPPSENLFNTKKTSAASIFTNQRHEQQENCKTLDVHCIGKEF